MKKLLLLLLFGLLSVPLFSQTVVLEDDFTNDTYPGWAFYDEDGDGNNWGDLNQIPDGDGGFVTPPSLISRSWQGSPLTPDNWAVSPAVDLTNASGNIELEYITQVAAQSWDEEKYSLYISTTDDINAIKNLTADLTETLGDPNDTGNPVTHNIDLTSYSGQTVYVVFRHWDTTDMDYLAIHSMDVTADNLSSEEFALSNFEFFISNDKLIISANQSFDQINIFDLSGKQIMDKELSSNDENISIQNLANGLYLAKVKIGEQTKTFKFIK